MTQPRHINYKSDFVLRERFRDAAGKIVPLPDGVDFVLTYTVKHGHTFTASRSGNAYENCLPDGDALLVIFKDHGLCEGTLRRELHLQLINDLMPDGLQNVYFPADPAVELWQFATDSPGVVECDLLAAYTRGLPFTYEDFTPEQLAALKGDKGDPFTWADFTPAQIEILKKPATEAATLANTAAKKADTAANEVREQAQNLAATSSEAVKTCNAATQAAKAATGAAEQPQTTHATPPRQPMPSVSLQNRAANASKPWPTVPNSSPPQFPTACASSARPLSLSATTCPNLSAPGCSPSVRFKM